MQTSARKYYVNTDGENRTDGSRNEKSKRSRMGSHNNNNNTTVVSAHHTRSARHKQGDDDLSDKSILGYDGANHGKQHIMQTHEIAVEYEMEPVSLKH